MSHKRNIAYALLLAVVVMAMLAGMGVVIGIMLSAQNPMMDMTCEWVSYYTHKHTQECNMQL